MNTENLTEIFELVSAGVGVGVALSTLPYILGVGISTLFKIMKSG